MIGERFTVLDWPICLDAFASNNGLVLLIAILLRERHSNILSKKEPPGLLCCQLRSASLGSHVAPHGYIILRAILLAVDDLEGIQMTMLEYGNIALFEKRPVCALGAFTSLVLILGHFQGSFSAV